jgi:hypothetical protein
MQSTFICENCGHKKQADPRQKGNQRFCGNSICQRARKAQWHRMKMKTDPTYRAQQYDCKRQWRKQRPVDRYQSHYRQTHPEYVEENRRKQQLRNQKRRAQSDLEVIVKMDALSSIKSETYIIKPIASEKIVKMDALVVELKLLQHI